MQPFLVGFVWIANLVTQDWTVSRWAFNGLEQPGAQPAPGAPRVELLRGAEPLFAKLKFSMSYFFCIFFGYRMYIFPSDTA